MVIPIMSTLTIPNRMEREFPKWDEIDFYKNKFVTVSLFVRVLFMRREVHAQGRIYSR